MSPPSPHLHRRRPLILFALLGASLAVAPAAAAAPVRPTAHTGAAGAITYQSANLTGSVNPGAAPTTYFFQYGRSVTYGSQSAPAPLAGGARAVNVASLVAGLIPLTKYHYRLVAVNAVGTALGADASFTTAAIPLTLAIGALPSPVVFGSPLSVVGTLSGTGAAGRTVILQENPFPFTAGFQSVGNPELTSPTGAFQFNLFSLPATTQFRVVSVGPGQPVISMTLTEEVAIGVTMHVRTSRLHTGAFALRFSGVVSPAEVGARVLVQRLVGAQWKTVTATNAHAATPASSSYAVTVHRHHGGFFRVFVMPVEGGHIAGPSQPLLVHAGRGL